MIVEKDGKQMLVHGCTRCGRCCLHRGDIYPTPWDVLRIANYLKISTETFVEKFCDKVGLAELAFKTIGDEKKCIFNVPDEQEPGKTRCSIYPVRPIACYTFPVIVGSSVDKLFVSQDPFASYEAEPVDINEYMVKSSSGQYVFDFIKFRIQYEVIKKFYSKDHTQEECDEFIKYWFINSSEDEISQKATELNG